MLDSKRSNAINIGLTKLPPPRTIKTAVMRMDSSIINREGIEVRQQMIQILEFTLAPIVGYCFISNTPGLTDTHWGCQELVSEVSVLLFISYFQVVKIHVRYIHVILFTHYY